MPLLSIVRVADEKAAGALRDAFAGAPGCAGARAGRAVDADTHVVVAEWDGFGSYRRALSSYAVKLLTPRILAARDEPTAYEVLPAPRPGTPGTGGAG